MIINKPTAILLTALSLAMPALAGTESKAFKETKSVVEPLTCFKDQEFQIDLFGQYNVGNGPFHLGTHRDHGWGGGVGVNYFFSRYVGIGAEYTASYTKESPDTDFGLDRGNHQTVHGAGGSVFLRLPIEGACLAPYAYVGGGAFFADRNWASAHAGVGVEYRVVPQKLGIFVDGRWTYLGDRHFADTDETRGDLNFFSARAGVRIVF